MLWNPWRWRDPYAEIYMDPFWRNVVRHLARGRLERRDELLELSLGLQQPLRGHEPAQFAGAHFTQGITI